MLRRGEANSTKWAATVLVGVVIVGLFVWNGARTQRRLLDSKSTAPPKVSTTAPLASTGLQNGLAMRYAKAVQEGDCDVIIPHTEWMRERLKVASSEENRGEAGDKIREDLCDRIQKRVFEGNQLRKEGIEDQYIFAPGAVFEVVGVDKGRDDLSKPVRLRTWIRVTYPLRSRAPANERGRPIHSLVVGVNVSTDDCVLKANVIGNLEINYQTLNYDWSSGTSSGG